MSDLAETRFTDTRLEELADLPENLRYSYIDKFQILDGPLNQPPYKCAGCGNHILSKEQGYVDWGFSVDFYGQVCFCTDCFRQAANQLCFMDPQQVRQLVEAKSKLIRENSDLINEVTELRNALASIGIVTRDPVIDGVPFSGATQQREIPAGQSISRGGQFRASVENEFTAASTESKSVRQNTSKRSSQLSGDDTLDQLLGDSI